ncbi:hypothetical protein T261_2713 [Streptomyces lydicus]|nr:hypothetical protein T261_2713 [Streptomyces lydicus]
MCCPARCPWSCGPGRGGGPAGYGGKINSWFRREEMQSDS